jgi:hypothetical protein
VDIVLNDIQFFNIDSKIKGVEKEDKNVYV